MCDCPHVEVMVEDPGWGDPTATVEAAVAATLRHAGLDSAGYEISVLLADDARIRALNARFRGRDAPTNVLSWPAADLLPDAPGQPPHPPEPGSPDAPAALGDIALGFGICRAEAEAAGRPLADHLSHLCVHAVLHLLGHDHETDADADLMERQEVAILSAMGICDPYAVAPGTET